MADEPVAAMQSIPPVSPGIQEAPESPRGPEAGAAAPDVPVPAPQAPGAAGPQPMAVDAPPPAGPAPMMIPMHVAERPEAPYGQGLPVWAMMKSFPPWPAMVMTEAESKFRGLKPGGASAAGKQPKVNLIFLGTYEVATMLLKDVVPLREGIERRLYAPTQRQIRGGKLRRALALKELEDYLRDGEIPDRLLTIAELGDLEEPEEVEQEDEAAAGGAKKKGKKKAKKPKALKFGNLVVQALGRVEYVDESYHNEKFIFPAGYRATRQIRGQRFLCEIVQGPSCDGPSFEISVLAGEGQGRTFKAASAPRAWKQVVDANLVRPPSASCHQLFGYNHPAVAKRIQELPGAERCERYSDWPEGEAPVCPPLDPEELKRREACRVAKQTLPEGIAPVDLKLPVSNCHVCGKVEDHVDNMLVQCDGCKMMVHMACYGIKSAPKGQLWLCNVCDLGLQACPPACVVCPVVGGAMKPTTKVKGAVRFIHTACSIWTPETTILDVDRMEPVHGVDQIAKARFSLRCTFCKQKYGSCIQCEDEKCYTAFHPLCARAAGCTMEIKDAAPDDQGEERVKLVAWCPKHGKAAPPSRAEPLEGPSAMTFEGVEEYRKRKALELERAGCARAVPFDAKLRRGFREPDAIAAALAKRGVVKSLPYIVTGRKRMKPLEKLPEKYLDANRRTRERMHPPPQGILSSAERFKQMADTVHERLAFGKSAIHGIGLFCKTEHKKGELIIEYIGEAVRPTVADNREKGLYATMVGAGTYIFKLNDSTCVDATRSGNVAHLINHSCDPNCASRVFDNEDESHVAIFALRDLQPGEELTYDYRFAGDEKLPCNCGTARCRGQVNVSAEEENFSAPKSEVTFGLGYCDWPLGVGNGGRAPHP